MAIHGRILSFFSKKLCVLNRHFRFLTHSIRMENLCKLFNLVSVHSLKPIAEMHIKAVKHMNEPKLGCIYGMINYPH